MKREEPGKTPPEWNIDVLFGLNWVNAALLKALIQTHPDCERLLEQFDPQLKEAIEIAQKSGRSKLEESAVTDYGAQIRGLIERRAQLQAKARE